MNTNITTVLIGTSGIALSKTVEIAQTLDPTTINSTIGLVSQIVILLATLFGLFKKKTQ